jgi:pimeloyl-ACP methyl ester carboxylesterase
MNTIRCGYADGRHGQIHYRELKAAAPRCSEPLVLLHWAPSNGRQYEHMLPLFAARGLHVLAVDIPGYGRSHKDAVGWSCAQMADEIAVALAALCVERGFVVGGHLSAAIAAEMAIAAPARWPRIVLDGSPTLLPDEMVHLMQRFAGLSPALSDSGAHRSFVWDMTERFLGEWDPEYRVTPETLPVQYAYMADYLQMGFAPIRAFIDPANTQKGGLGTYRVLERWPLIESQVLAMTAEREALRAGHARAVGLLRDVREHCFPGSHPIMNPARAGEYVDVVAPFLLGEGLLSARL